MLIASNEKMLNWMAIVLALKEQHIHVRRRWPMHVALLCLDAKPSGTV